MDWRIQEGEVRRGETTGRRTVVVRTGKDVGVWGSTADCLAPRSFCPVASKSNRA